MSIEAPSEYEVPPEFSEQDITMAQQLAWKLRLTRTLDRMVFENGAFHIEIDGYPLTIDRHFVDTWKNKFDFTSRYQPFVDKGQKDLARDIYLATMESQR